MYKYISCLLVILLSTALLMSCATSDGPTTEAMVPGTSSSTTQSTSSTTGSTSGSTSGSTAGSTAPTTTGTTAPEQPPLLETETMRTVTNTGLYAAPNAEEAPVMTLEKDAHIEVAEQQGDWAVVVMEEEMYYIPSAHVRQLGKYLVVIDAGHQKVGNLDKEPDGPGSTTMKYKVSYGATGSFSGMKEYELNLLVSVKLQAELERRGYEVVMIRTTHDVDISNSERAMVANNLYADAFIRIHANSSDNANDSGVMTICQTSKNPYNASLYSQCRLLSDLVLTETVRATEAKKMYVWETDTMSGVNWCQVPVTIVEMGFMSNQAEDLRMATDDYQQKLALGIANGIDLYIQQTYN